MDEDYWYHVFIPKESSNSDFEVILPDEKKSPPEGIIIKYKWDEDGKKEPLELFEVKDGKKFIDDNDENSSIISEGELDYWSLDQIAKDAFNKHKRSYKRPKRKSIKPEKFSKKEVGDHQEKDWNWGVIVGVIGVLLIIIGSFGTSGAADGEWVNPSYVALTFIGLIVFFVAASGIFKR